MFRKQKETLVVNDYEIEVTLEIGITGCVYCYTFDNGDELSFLSGGNCVLFKYDRSQEEVKGIDSVEDFGEHVIYLLMNEYNEK